MEHTLTAYEQELRRLEGLILEMGRHGIAQLQRAIHALEGRLSLVAQDVIQGDEIEDRLELEVDELVVRVIALRQPTAGDLRHVTTAFKASVHFERIGDYAANLAKRSLVMPKELSLQALFGIPEMGKWTLGMLEDTVRAYETRDHQLALSTWRRDETLDTLTGELFLDVMESMQNDPRSIEVGTHLMFIGKNLERIGDHATNICELIHYRVTGERLPRDRPRHSVVATIAPRTP